MDDYMVALNNASVSISGEGFVAEAGVGRADSSMSASAAPPPMPRKAARNKQSNFSSYEDNLLCKSWLEIGCDAITNTGQRKEAFWRRVVERYNSVGQGKFPERSQRSIMSRWEYIKAEVNKFSGHMAEMIRSNPSGLSDADKSVAAAADFAAIEKHNFTLMHCWRILKDEPKWMELKSKMDNPQNSSSSAQPLNLNLYPDDPSPASSTGKRPMGRDAAKAAKKKATSSGSSEYASKLHELSVQKIELLKDTEAERKTRLDEIVALEKMKAEEAREHRKMMLELEKERLAMDQIRLQMEAEKKQKEDDERILAINLDLCQPIERMYYEALQQDILEKMMARRRGPSQ
ncbi:unnamed protein product [Urochloa decumbens]|uniref:No apical meristem-associated C-terminal domain-containing protein n=1 Tax=Urochloa decumbens TaxID=240449 RepID=A0ABC9FIU1_9POAL